MEMGCTSTGKWHRARMGYDNSRAKCNRYTYLGKRVDVTETNCAQHIGHATNICSKCASTKEMAGIVAALRGMPVPPPPPPIQVKREVKLSLPKTFDLEAATSLRTELDGLIEEMGASKGVVFSVALR